MAAGDMKRIVIIGFGGIAKFHLEVFRAHGCDVVAVCDLMESGRANALDAGIPKTYSNLSEMLNVEKPDGAVCTVSQMAMYDVGAEIIRHEIPMLIEKPPGVSMDELDRLIDFADSHKSAVQVGLNRRHYSIVEKAISDCGGLNNITSVFVEWSERLDLFTRRGMSDDTISRMIYGYSLHGIDLATYLGGAIHEANVTAYTLGDPFRWMMGFQGRSERGALTSFTSTWDSPGRWRMAFGSPDSQYIFAPLETCQVLKFDKQNVKDGKWSMTVKEIEPDPVDKQYKPGFHKQAELFLQLINEERDPTMHDLRSAIPSMNLAEAMTDKCRSG